MANNKNSRGRPVKLKFERKKEIVDSFLELEANSDVQKLLAYNIYSMIATFASKMNWRGDNGQALRPKDFQDEQTRAYIQKLANSDCQHAPKHNIHVPVYIPFDVSNFMAKSFNEQVHSLKERDSYYQSVCIMAGNVVKEYAKLRSEVNQGHNTLVSIEQEKREMMETLETLQKELKMLKAENRMLRRVTKTINSTLTQEYFDSIPTRGLKKETLRQMAHNPIACANPCSKDNESTIIDLDALFENGGSEL